MVTIAKASGMAKETEGSTIADASRTCSNRGSRKNKYSNSIPHSEGRAGTV